jgi:hypothetical protein
MCASNQATAAQYSATTARPVGLDLQTATLPSQQQQINSLVGRSGNPLESFYANPNDVLKNSSQYAALSDLTNRNINAQINPVAANLKQQVQQNEQDQYNKQIAFAQDTGPGSATQQIENAALRSGLGSIFTGGAAADSSFGRASLQSALGQGVLGANEYQQNVLNAANSNANGVVASNYGQYTPSGASLENLDLTQQQNQVAARNAATQNLLQNQAGAATAFQGTINNAADQLQSTENNNVNAQNQASAADVAAQNQIAAANLQAQSQLTGALISGGFGLASKGIGAGAGF